MGFFDNFFGNTQADDISNARAEADRLYQAGLDKFKGTTEDYLGKSLEPFGALAPYGQAGTDTLAILRNALGLGGQGAQQSFFSNLKAEPGYQGGLNAGIDALDKS